MPNIASSRSLGTGNGNGTANSNVTSSSNLDSHTTPAAVARATPAAPPLPSAPSPAALAPSSSAPTVTLQPIIKTNHAQAMALEMNMIPTLSSNDDAAGSTAANTNSSSYRQNSQPTPIVHARTTGTNTGNGNTLYTFPLTLEESRRSMAPPTEHIPQTYHATSAPTQTQTQTEYKDHSDISQKTGKGLTVASPHTGADAGKDKPHTGAGTGLHLPTSLIHSVSDLLHSSSTSSLLPGPPNSPINREGSPTIPLLSEAQRAQSASTERQVSAASPAPDSANEMTSPNTGTALITASSASRHPTLTQRINRSSQKNESRTYQPSERFSFTGATSSCLPCLSSSSSASLSSPSSKNSSHVLLPPDRPAPYSPLALHSSSTSIYCDQLVTCNPFRLSFRFTLVLLCILQVVVAVGIVWYLGYSDSTSLIGNLSSQLRQTALVEITGAVHDQMVLPMRAVNQLVSNYHRIYPEFGENMTSLDVPGIFADISLIVMNFPEISGASCYTWNNMALGAINISAYLSAGASPGSTSGVTTGFAYSFVDYGSTTLSYHFTNTGSNTLGVPNDPLPDYNATSTLADLGPLWYTSQNFVPTQRPQFMAAVAGNGDFIWAPLYQMARSNQSTIGQSNTTVLAAGKAHINSTGQAGFACFATIFLGRAGDLLRSLSVAYGTNGLALITDRTGIILTTSDSNLSYLASEQTTIPIYDIDDPRLQAISQPLLDHQIFNPEPNTSSPTGQFVYGGLFYQNNPAFDAEPININGDAYHLQATILNNTGLDWVIVVVTKDSDFDGGLAQHELVVGMLSMMVLILAIIVMVVITQCLNRPLALVVRYMSAVAKMGKERQQQVSTPLTQSMADVPGGGSSSGSAAQIPPLVPTLSRSAEHLKQLQEIYTQWKSDTQISFSDDYSDNNKHNSSSKSLSTSKTSANKTADDTMPTPVLPSRTANWCSRVVNNSAICLMREVEDMQLTFHSMLHQLTKSTEEVEAANEAKRHFVRYIFHEVRVPLNAVMLGLADLRASCGMNGSHAEWTEEQRDVLDIVHEQSQVVGRILNDVLSLHKIEDGALTLQYAPFSLESMILSTMQSFQPGIHDKQIHYTAQLQTVQNYVFTAGQWSVESNNQQQQQSTTMLGIQDYTQLPQIDVIGDKYRLRQVLANFLSNAIKFTPTHGNVHVSLQIFPLKQTQQQATLMNATAAPGAVTPLACNTASTPSPRNGKNATIPFAWKDESHKQQQALEHHTVVDIETTPPTTVSTIVDVHTGRRIYWPASLPHEAVFRIAVCDSGVGVNSEDQKKLFSPYMQILPGELQKGAGTGLGLSIAQNLIRIHGGEIGFVTPENGKGSEFYMTLPLRMDFRRSGPNSTPQTAEREIDGKDNTPHTGSGSSRRHAQNQHQHNSGHGAAGQGKGEEDEDSDLLLDGTMSNEERAEEEAIIRDLAGIQVLQQQLELQHQQQHQQQQQQQGEQQQQQQGGVMKEEQEVKVEKHSAMNDGSPSVRVIHPVAHTASGSSLLDCVHLDRSESFSATKPSLLDGAELSQPSPDSSMRILAQQRMHIQELRGGATSGMQPSPKLALTSYRLLSLAHIPSTTTETTIKPTGPLSIGDQSGGTGISSSSGADSASNSVADNEPEFNSRAGLGTSSRSVSLIMHDGVNTSPLQYKASPARLNRQLLRKMEEKQDHKLLGLALSATDRERDKDTHTSASPDQADNPFLDEQPLNERSRSHPLSTPLFSAAAGSSVSGSSPPKDLIRGIPTSTILRGSSIETGNTSANHTPTGNTPTSAGTSRSNIYITLATYGQTHKTNATQNTTPPSPASHIIPTLPSPRSASSNNMAALPASPPGNPTPPSVPQLSSRALHSSSYHAQIAQISTPTSNSTAPAPPTSASWSSPSSRNEHLEKRREAVTHTATTNSALPPEDKTTSQSQTQHTIGGPAPLDTQTQSPSLSSATSRSPRNSRAAEPTSSQLSQSEEKSSVQTSSVPHEKTLLPTPPALGVDTEPASPLLYPAASPVMSPLSSSPLSALTPTDGTSGSFVATSASPTKSPPVLRILVAEDSVANLKLLLVLLRKMKVMAEGVENGQLAVEKFSTWYQQHLSGQQENPYPYDVILMDGNMPILSGMSATRQLRAMGVTIPIYAVTGNAMAEDTQAFIAAGATPPVLTKPVQQKELQNLVLQLTKKMHKQYQAKLAGV